MHKRLKGFLLFVLYVVASNLFGFALGWLLVEKFHLLNPGGAWRPSMFIGGEAIGVVGSLFGTWVVALAGRRRFADLGYAGTGAVRQLFFGAFFGLASVTILVGAIAALGGFTFGSLAMSGAQLATYVGAWLAAFAFVGLAEEMDFRAASLLTLAEAIGFWPAAILISIIFAALHYFFKPMENIADALSVGLLGLFMAFTVLRTRAIWFAVGFHALFDYSAIFLFGAPNSGNKGVPAATKLLTGGYHGPAWLTGGPLGVEASWLVFPLIALMFLTFHWVHRPSRYNPPVPAPENLGGTA